MWKQSSKLLEREDRTFEPKEIFDSILAASGESSKKMPSEL
jgi:hypothetical protein